MASALRLYMMHVVAYFPIGPITLPACLNKIGNCQIVVPNVCRLLYRQSDLGLGTYISARSQNFFPCVCPKLIQIGIIRLTLQSLLHCVGSYMCDLTRHCVLVSFRSFHASIILCTRMLPLRNCGAGCSHKIADDDSPADG